MRPGWKKVDRQPGGCCCDPEQKWWRPRPRGEQGPEGGCVRDSHDKKKHRRDQQDGMDGAQYWKIKGTRRHDCHGWHALGKGKRQTQGQSAETWAQWIWGARRMNWQSWLTTSIWPPALDLEIQNETPAEKKPVKWETDVITQKATKAWGWTMGNTGMKGEKEVKGARKGSQERRREQWTHQTGCQERPSGFGFSEEPRAWREDGKAFSWELVRNVESQAPFRPAESKPAF